LVFQVSQDPRCKDVTVIAFIIYPAAANSFNVDSLRGQAVCKQLKDTIAKIKENVAMRMFEESVRGRVPDPEELLLPAEKVQLKRCILAAKPGAPTSVCVCERPFVCVCTCGRAEPRRNGDDDDGDGEKEEEAAVLRRTMEPAVAGIVVNPSSFLVGGYHHNVCFEQVIMRLDDDDVHVVDEDVVDEGHTVPVCV
uniref:Glycogen [starch] synthase n=1 Tax=Heligmosomoides polygyrus TaxID=6339 RepID=A0A8L8KAA8_HELPZ